MRRKVEAMHQVAFECKLALHQLQAQPRGGVYLADVRCWARIYLSAAVKQCPLQGQPKGPMAVSGNATRKDARCGELFLPGVIPLNITLPVNPRIPAHGSSASDGLQPVFHAAVKARFEIKHRLAHAMVHMTQQGARQHMPRIFLVLYVEMRLNPVKGFQAAEILLQKNTPAEYKMPCGTILHLRDKLHAKPGLTRIDRRVIFVVLEEGQLFEA